MLQLVKRVGILDEEVADEARFAAFTAGPGLSRRKILAQARKELASLPKTEFPTIVALAEHLTEDAQDELFQFGIDMWVRALEELSRAAQRRPRSRAR